MTSSRPYPDAYRILQVDPSAHEVVIRAAYHALARRYHPDGPSPDPLRMAELNSAYDQVRDTLRRRIYDQQRVAVGPGRSPTMEPVGPGEEVSRVAAGVPPAQAATTVQPSPNAGPFSRFRPAGATEAWSRLDFGRYAGWSLRDLARHDPDYLRWLSRHSSGLRFRSEIERLLPGDEEVGRQNRS